MYLLSLANSKANLRNLSPESDSACNANRCASRRQCRDSSQKGEITGALLSYLEEVKDVRFGLPVERESKLGRLNGCIRCWDTLRVCERNQDGFFFGGGKWSSM